jgi:hypothetical protein
VLPLPPFVHTELVDRPVRREDPRVVERVDLAERVVARDRDDRVDAPRDWDGCRDRVVAPERVDILDPRVEPAPALDGWPCDTLRTPSN